jgi:hypothetical protein
MTCIPFIYNIAHELKGIGMKTKRIWVGYMIKFLDMHFTDIQWGRREWKKVRVKCIANFFVLGSYMLQQLALITLKCQTFPQNFVHCCVWHV